MKNITKITILFFCLIIFIIFQSVFVENSGSNTTLIDLINDQQDTAAIELINKGYLINSKNEYGYTPLHVASMLGNNKIAELLIKKGANLNAKSNQGIIPLISASALSGKISTVKLLFDNMNDFNIKNNNNQSLLIQSVELNDFYLLQNLLIKNIDINHKDKYGKTALHYAINKIEGDAKIDLKMDSNEIEEYKSNRYGILLLLLNNNSDINTTDNSGHSPLSLSKTHTDKNISIILLEKSFKNVIIRSDN